ncbi:tyrosine-protein phosphatase [Microbacterium sp.]|uniref:tyrosine-protein phosphatase n=1 Tax=Microbacterium sp. TaxID=51671 RepID=UPI00281216E9|nr:tyrosine-protein phosphatase [Microbacterium sp.]
MTHPTPTPATPDELRMLPPGHPSRRIPLDGTFNFRDVGGYPSERLGSLRAGALYRSDALGDLTESDRGVLSDLGVQTVIDLRESAEIASYPDRLDGLAILEVHVPVFEDSLFAGSYEHLTEPMTLEGLYDEMLTVRARQLATAVETLGAPEGRFPAVVHCTAGKDRTGVVVAMLLGALDVPLQWIVDDFAATELFLGPAFVKRIEEHYRRNGFPASMAASPTRAPASLMSASLQRVTDEYGTVEGFLLGHGATRASLDRIRNALAG